jgi:hypothetical protein
MRRPALLAAAAGGLALLLRRRSKAQQAESALWTEAAAPSDKPAAEPDLR